MSGWCPRGDREMGLRGVGELEERSRAGVIEMEGDGRGQ